MGPIGDAGPDNRHVDRVERLQAPLAGNLKPPDRFDLVAEELDAHRPVPVGSEDVDDAAADGKLAGQLHGRGVEKIVFHQPFGQLADGHGVADAERARVPGEGLAAGNWLQKALNAGHNELRCDIGLASRFSRCSRWPKTSSCAVRSKRFRGREPLRVSAG